LTYFPPSLPPSRPTAIRLHSALLLSRPPSSLPALPPILPPSALRTTLPQIFSAYGAVVSEGCSFECGPLACVPGLLRPARTVECTSARGQAARNRPSWAARTSSYGALLCNAREHPPAGAVPQQSQHQPQQQPRRRCLCGAPSWSPGAPPPGPVFRSSYSNSRTRTRAKRAIQMSKRLRRRRSSSS